MRTDLEGVRLGAQEMLDELFEQDLIPFTLSARVVESIGMEEYIVRFNAGRLRSLDVSWHQGQIFNTVLRAAILGRVSRLKTPRRTA